MQESLHFIGAPAANSRIVFVDGAGAVQSFAAEQQPGGQPPLSAAVPDSEANGAAAGAALPDRAAARQAKRRASVYRQLLEAREEAEQVEQLVARLRAAKVAASRGRRTKERTSGSTGPAAPPRFKGLRQR